MSQHISDRRQSTEGFADRQSFSPLKWISAFLFILTLVVLVLPLTPRIVASDLDASWAMGMNYLVSHGYAIGKDVIFTFGPYASTYHLYYSPDSAMLLYGGCGYLLVCFIAASIPIVYKSSSLLLMLFTYVFSAFLTRDAMLYSYCVFVVVSCAVVLDHNNNSRWLLPYLGLIVGGLGLLVACKSSFMIPAAVAVIGMVVMLSARKRFACALVVVLTVPASLSVLWIIAGQRTVNIFYYLKNASIITAGYTELMSLNGNSRDILIFILASVGVMTGFIVATSRSLVNKTVVMITIMVFLFMGLKAGFVRHDTHAFTAAAIVLVASCCAFLFSARAAMPGVVLSMVAAIVIDVGMTHSFWQTLIENPYNTYRSAWAGLSKNLRGNNLNISYKESMANIAAEQPLPLLAGTSDLYPYSLAYLIASGNRWQPRAVIQSYPSYGPFAQADAEHLRGLSKPDHIFVRLEAIDSRPFAMELGPSLVEMLGRYKFVDQINGALRYDVRKGAVPIDPLLIAERHAHFGEWVDLPPGGGLVFAKFRFRRDFVSKVVTSLYKPPLASIDLRLAGALRHYRAIPNMMESGYLLSPDISSLSALSGLSVGYVSQDDVVQSFKIDQAKGMGQLPGDYDVSFYKIVPTQSATDAYDRFRPEATPDVKSTKECDASIDTVESKSPHGYDKADGTLLSFSGWASLDAAKGVTADKIYLTLYSESTGRTLKLATKRSKRPDVAAYFKQPKLIDSGFVANGLTTDLKGTYTVGIAISSKDNRDLDYCTNSRRTLQIP